MPNVGVATRLYYPVSAPNWSSVIPLREYTSVGTGCGLVIIIFPYNKTLVA